MASAEASDEPPTLAPTIVSCLPNILLSRENNLGNGGEVGGLQTVLIHQFIVADLNIQNYQCPVIKAVPHVKESDAMELHSELSSVPTAPLLAFTPCALSHTGTRLCD